MAFQAVVFLIFFFFSPLGLVFHNRRSLTCGVKTSLKLPERQNFIVVLCPAFQADVCVLFVRRSLTYGYENLAFQALNYRNQIVSNDGEIPHCVRNDLII